MARYRALTAIRNTDYFPLHLGTLSGYLKHLLDAFGVLLDDDRTIFAGLSLSAVVLLWYSTPSFTDPLFWTVLIPSAAPYFGIGLRPQRKNVPLTIRNIIIAYSTVSVPVLAGLALSIILYDSTWSPLFFSPIIGSSAGLATGIGYQLLRHRGKQPS